MTRLALAGLIEGVPNSDDRRETQLRMTERGRALYEKLAPVVLDYEQRLLASFERGRAARPDPGPRQAGERWA